MASGAEPLGKAPLSTPRCVGGSYYCFKVAGGAEYLEDMTWEPAAGILNRRALAVGQVEGRALAGRDRSILTDALVAAEAAFGKDQNREAAGPAAGAW